MQDKTNYTSGTKVDFLIPRFHLQNINNTCNVCKGWYGSDNWNGYTGFTISETEITKYEFRLQDSAQSNAGLMVYWR